MFLILLQLLLEDKLQFSLYVCRNMSLVLRLFN